MNEPLREARPDEIAGWDARTVDVPGGDVQQSRAWAAHRARSGARPRHLVFPSGFAVLGLERRRPLIGGGRLYLPRGPVAAGEPATRTAERLAAVAAWARAAGLDAVLSDAEIPAATGYAALLAELGFRPVEEVGPSRHRVAVPIPAGADDAALLEPIAKATRQRFGSAERRGARVVRYDALAGSRTLPGFEAPSGGAAGAAARAAFARFHGLLVATGERRGFAIGPLEAAVAWWTAAFEAGHLVLLEVRSREDDLLAAAILYRHGRRLSYAHSGDRVELRHAHPGAIHLLLWRALQLAAREGRAELDLGGVDVAGARDEPRPGEPMWGLYEFKRSFGGRWVEMSGAHEAVLRPVRHLLGAALAGAARCAGRGRARSGGSGGG